MNTNSNGAAPRGQLSLAGLLVGAIGCVIITASSAYTALKMGALPWPTIFTSLTALVCLRALGKTSVADATITQVIMSAGSMVAGGLAFTVPAIWILGERTPSPWVLLAVTLAGTLLGLVATALIRRRFIDESDLEYPIGVAAAETLKVGSAGAGAGVRLFVSMGLSGLWCICRDVLALMPVVAFQLPVPGVAFGLYNSPMLVSVGFLLGVVPAIFWLVGALLVNVGLPLVAQVTGFTDPAQASVWASSLGMGLMMGSGVGVILKDIVPSVWRSMRSRSTARTAPAADDAALRRRFSSRDRILLSSLAICAAALLVFALKLNPLVLVAAVVLTFIASIMSAQSVGSTGIDPMEVFAGLVAVLCAGLVVTGHVELLLIAAAAAIACGLAGDVMSDFKTGALLDVSPRTLWVAQAVGALLGAAVSVVVILVLFNAFGPQSFGPGKAFVAAQANMVAALVGGIPAPGFFAAGLAAGVGLYMLGVPAMMIGLGAYLPFYMSATAVLGALVRLVWERLGARSSRTPEQREASSTMVASGVLGGESIVGVVIALVSLFAGM